MKEIGFEVSTEINMKYDPNSEEFKDAYESYMECIDSKASVDDMLSHIAWYVTSYGAEGMIEGVGYVSVDGEKKGDPDNWCGVDIEDVFNINDTAEFDVRRVS